MEKLEDLELRSILGHELGHFLFDNHHLDALISDDQNNPRASVHTHSPRASPARYTRGLMLHKCIAKTKRGRQKGDPAASDHPARWGTGKTVDIWEFLSSLDEHESLRLHKTPRLDSVEIYARRKSAPVERHFIAPGIHLRIHELRDLLTECVEHSEHDV